MEIGLISAVRYWHTFSHSSTVGIGVNEEKKINVKLHFLWGWGGSCLELALCFLDSTAEVSMTHRDTADTLMGNTAGGNKAD